MTFIALANEWLAIDFTLFGAVVLSLFGKVLTVEQAIAGFANEAVISIGLLYILAAGIQRTGALEALMSVWFQKPSTGTRRALLRILPPVALTSSVFNDTPLVALLIPIVRRWCRRFQIAPSKVLMPISFAALLGGMLTLVGTSNNLFVSGLMISAGMEPLGLFELTPIAIVATVAGLVFLVTFGPRLLPNHAETTSPLETSKDFICVAKVSKNYPFLNKTVEEASLRELKGLFLFQIIRANKDVVAPLGRFQQIEEGDDLPKFAPHRPSSLKIANFADVMMRLFLPFIAMEDASIRKSEILSCKLMTLCYSWPRGIFSLYGEIPHTFILYLRAKA